MVVSDTKDVPGPQKERGEPGKGEQPTSLVEAEVCDLLHIGCKTAGVNRYSALENQRQVLARLMKFVTRLLFGEYKVLMSLSTDARLFSLEKAPSAHNLHLQF